MANIVPPRLHDDIRTQLAKLLKSGPFAGTERLRRFLEFIVEQTLGFPNQPLKEIVIGCELYASDGNFDPWCG
jgi:hypothetical protein